MIGIPCVSDNLQHHTNKNNMTQNTYHTITNNVTQQLPTSATAEEREKIRFEFLTHTMDTHGRFGCAEERIWPCMIGMNKKGQMMDDEFEKYINNSIVPLYPDLEDTPGKCILLKVDSGPGCNGTTWLWAQAKT